MSELIAPVTHTAVIAAATTWEAFPQLWPVLLAEVWAAVRSRPGVAANRNVMLYRDDLPTVEVGVEVAERFAPLGRVVPGMLPSGRVVTATHVGSYGGLAATHEAIVAWCERRALRRAGPRWEIYGHWNEDAAAQQVEVSYLLR